MKLTTVLLAILLGIAAFPNQVFSDDDYNDYAEDDAGKEDVEDSQGPPPRIVSTGAHMSLALGDTISLACKVENAESAVIQWRLNTETPLFFDKMKQIKNDRFELDDQFTVHIKDVKEEDEGVYTCEILGEEEQIIRYTVEINSVPKIRQIVPDESPKILKKGNPLTLMCEAVGEPKPRIFWTHKKKHGVKEEPLVGEMITYDQVSRKTSGEYTCTADNGKGRDQKTVVIDVHYEPEIEIQKEVVNSAEGYESELMCIVHAHPAAKVSWLKDDKAVRDSHHIQQLNEGNQHILRISNTKNTDFGSYKCIARNDMGLSNKTIVLSGKPSKPAFFSTHVSADDNKSPVLTWKVSSHSPITAFELMYKKQQDDKWDTASPTVTADGENSYTATHTLRNLEPGTYIAQLRAKNIYGWSSLSDAKSFSGDVIGVQEAMQTKLLVSSMNGNSAPSNLEMRISLVFVLSLFVAHLLS